MSRVSEIARTGQRSFHTAPERVIDLNAKYTANIKTKYGDISVDLATKDVPNTVNNFVFLASIGFYDDLTFYRVITNPPFVIQGGDPNGDGTGGPGYIFADEFHPDWRHDTPGVLSMANSGPNTNGSQFFLTLSAQPHLDNHHTVFGKVTSDLMVLEGIKQGDRILRIEIEEAPGGAMQREFPGRSDRLNLDFLSAYQHSGTLKNIGSAIRVERQKLQMTVAELSHRIGYSPSYLSKIENGGMKPSLTLLKSIERELGLLSGHLLSDALAHELPERKAGEPESDSSGHQLERSIEFPAAYKQAGIAILSQFSDILTREYPDEDIAVSIIQNGNLVTLRIVRPNGSIDSIQKRLDDYGLVITGRMPVEAFSNDKELIRDLTTRLEISKLELRLQQQYHSEVNASHEKRFLSLEDQVTKLHAVIAAGLAQSSTLAEIIKSVTSQNIISNEALFALAKIEALSVKQYSEENETEFLNALEDLRLAEPSVYNRIIDLTSSIPFGIIANLATPWVQQLLANIHRVT